MSALVKDATVEAIELTFVNTDDRSREVIVQAGAYGEYEFTTVRTDGAEEGPMER